MFRCLRVRWGCIMCEMSGGEMRLMVGTTRTMVIVGLVLRVCRNVSRYLIKGWHLNFPSVPHEKCSSEIFYSLVWLNYCITFDSLGFFYFLRQTENICSFATTHCFTFIQGTAHIWCNRLTCVNLYSHIKCFITE